MRYAKSKELRARAIGLLPCGAQTLSKAPDRFPDEYPTYIERGLGSHVWDVDGNEYIDYPLSLGPIILGHNYPAVTNAMRAQMEHGIVFSLSHPLELEVAERLCQMVPCAEAVRFTKTGSDAVMAAVRLSRTYTGREKVAVASNAYHGMHDWFQVRQPERGRAGVPRALNDTTLLFEYNSIESLQAVFVEHGPLAAVVIEPARTFEPAPGFLEAVKDLCATHGTVLIFDEVVTSFRWAIGGAQEYYGVTPDLACLGKAMANGLPLGAVVGKRDIMQAFERCFISGTYGGETLSLAAAKATLDVIATEPVVPQIWEHGELLRAAFEGITLLLGGEAVGVGPCSVQRFNIGRTEEQKCVLMRWLEETAKRGVLFGHIQYISYSHTNEDILTTVAVMREAAEAILDDSGCPEGTLQK